MVQEGKYKTDPSKSLHSPTASEPRFIEISVDGCMIAVYEGDTLHFHPEADPSKSYKHQVGRDLRQAAFCPTAPGDGWLLACLHEDGSVETLHSSGGACSQASQTDQFNGRARCVCWAPDGARLIVGCADGTVVPIAADLNRPRQPSCPDASLGSILHVKFLRLDRLVLVCAAAEDEFNGGDDGALRLMRYDAASGRMTELSAVKSGELLGLFPDESAEDGV